MIELLSTKLFIPPPRTNLVSRPSLVARLNARLDRKLTLITAAAGFGKTTLLSEWIPQSPRCVTWFSLDEGDNDSTRFWTYFISSLQGLRPDLGASALALLQSPQAPSINSILTALINDVIAFQDTFAIVLDDYHVIKSQPIHEAVTYLIAHLPANMHVIVATRTDPPLPLARLRARDKLTEIRAKNLRFTMEETASFFTREMGEKLTSEDVAMLGERTEGWIAGLKIAALSMQGREDVADFVRTFSGSHRHILGYLADEVINQRPAGTLDFLLQTSILDRLCGPLCDAVTGGSNGQAMLENLEHANVFITSLDDEGKWYRYHHLFAEVLQGRLRQSRPGEAPKLHQRASEWFEGNGLIGEAIEYALRGQDWNRAVYLIEPNMDAAQLRGEIFTLLRWLGALPDEAIREHPILGLSHALMLTIVDEFRDAEKRLEVVEHALRSSPLSDPDEQSALLGQLAAVREASALMLEYSGEEILAAGREALRLLPESDLARRGYALNLMGCAYYLQLGDVESAERAFQEALPLSRAAGDAFSELQIQVHLSQMRAVQGRLRAAEEPCTELMRLGTQPGWENIPAAGLGRIMLGRILYERNDLTGAQEGLTRGIAEVEGFSLKRAEIIGCILLTRVKLALRKMDQVRETLERAWDTIQRYNLKQITIPASAYHARLLLQMGDLKEATRWAATLELPTDGPLNPALEYDYITLSRVKLAQGQIAEARQLLTRLLPPAEEAGRIGRLIELLALQALVAFVQQEKAEALAALERALILGEPEGFVRSFVDEGEQMRQLLLDYQTVIKKKIGDGIDNQFPRLLTYIDRLLAAFSQGTPVEKPKQDGLPEPPSERELEILRLIAAGRSNQEIADILVIAVSTVKSHINNLYGKLGADRRTQAIAIARDLDLLSD
jgi:ATP/maltotriose-dependent transcriptional regulator MalT